MFVSRLFACGLKIAARALKDKSLSEKQTIKI